ncbi:glycosyltransferase family 2 protein [Burkholderia thailandensis]|uniref:glycosyltransferase family 2 protein n=1 Tax=Burkholderia thailandensis TaxID=57975 RepID=UPI0005B74D8F|nr:glycosyltransferase [Burkholderia thailandensis]AVR07013.1 glycosyl transferase [Burkholderia thailandensis]KIS53257.1 glycosyl transferase 21 family protein [Burkholderia thailandensis Phuket 4W-1]MCS6509576.1 glycosyltransferase family 2 protein [Burkholderia thailandensis]NBD06108.1 glycosyltransferase [Burkholderia thailandensis]NOK44687.1 glycosyl transferase [Burkholderia thailandensis]
MKNGRAMSLCVQCVLLLIVFACSLIVRDTAMRSASASLATVPLVSDGRTTARVRVVAEPSRPYAEAVAFAEPASLDAERSFAAASPPAVDAVPVSGGRIAAGLCAAYLWIFALLTCVYASRHYVFSLDRLFKPQHAPYRAIMNADWPEITVFVAAHNEEAVVADCLTALLATTYPRDRLTIVPVNDRSTDNTRALIDAVQVRAPELIRPFHRESGKPGKAAALKDALREIRGDIMIVFDADYLPRPGLLKELVAPFFDPEVGAVMGRVVPQNADRNLLARLLDLERAGGYQVNQQARNNLGLVPQYGGTVGGIRKSALDAVGGWRDDTLAEDTDMTYRLLLSNWRTVYLNHAECYEEVPERWPVRARQLTRWAKGHNQTLFRYLIPLLRSPVTSRRCRLDGVLLLGVFVMPALLALAWGIALVLYLTNGIDSLALGLLVSVFALFAFSTFGNFGVFFEIVVAARLDGRTTRLRLVPVNVVGFCVTIAAVVAALWGLALDVLLRRELRWDKTERFRRPVNSGR